MFAVSMKLIPTSNARFTHATALESSTPSPYVSQDPREISDTRKSLLPSCRYCMARCPAEIALARDSVHRYLTRARGSHRNPRGIHAKGFEMDRIRRRRTGRTHPDLRRVRLCQVVIAHRPHVFRRSCAPLNTNRLCLPGAGTSPRYCSRQMRGL